ncbi:MAG: IPT/TIG domain-containing protein [Planctomycetota bacterium]|jgi:hypothetical protein
MKALLGPLWVLSIAALAACGGGGSSFAPLPGAGGGLTVTTATPPAGPVLGGTTVTLVGSGFSAGAPDVLVGGLGASGVTVVDDATLTFVTPPAGAGAADIQVTIGADTALLPGGFTYGMPPSLTGLFPPTGTTSGGTALALTGSGFTDAAGGVEAVTVGGAPATNVIVQSDTTILCETPAGSAGTVDVTLTNTLGQITLTGAFTFVPPTLYAADGKANGPGNLYRIDPTTGAGTIVGPIGFAVTGLAVSPNGTLYGVEASVATLPNNLLVINTVTGTGTIVGSLGNVSIADITFVGSRLIGWDGIADTAVDIHPATAAVTPIGGAVIPTGGRAMESDVAGTVVFAPHRNHGALFTVNTTTGAATAGPTLTGAINPNGALAALAWFQGTLYGIDNGANATTTSAADLVTVDPATGATTLVGPMPTGIDALAGTTK